jgi:hypothetical protein
LRFAVDKERFTVHGSRFTVGDEFFTMKKRIWAFSLLLFVIMGAAASAAERTDSCHCFRNRVYNPAEKYAADDYLLTTVFNSLTAQYFGISKRQIVMMKMKGGVTSDNLLIGLYVSQCTGTDVNELLALKRKKTWPQVLSATRREVQSRAGCEMVEQLVKKVPAAEVAENIVRKMLQDSFAATPKTLDALRDQGLSSKEISLLLTLARHTQMEPEMISAQYREKKFSWSEIAYNFGLEPVEVGKLAGQSPAGQH